MTKVPLIVLLCLFCLSCVPAQAQNVSFSNLGLGGDEDILIYSVNVANETQELVGQYNTSSVHVPLPESDFQIVIKPSALRNAFDPPTLLDDTFTFVQNNVVSLIILAFLAAIYLGRK